MSTLSCTGDGACFGSEIDTVASAALLRTSCPHRCRMTPCKNAGVCNTSMPAWALQDGFCGMCCIMSSVDVTQHIVPPQECGVCLQTVSTLVPNLPVSSGEEKVCLHTLCVPCYKRLFCPLEYGPISYCPYGTTSDAIPRCPFCRARYSWAFPDR
jgi:hypothetical protein